MAHPSTITQKRLANEIKDMNKNRMDFAQAVQDEKDPFIFYFLLKPKDEPYKGGYFLGKIVLPKEYPAKAGDFYMLTPNGRFEIEKKICLTNSSYHQDTWTPTWSVRNQIVALMSIFLADDTTGISHIKESTEQRKKKVAESIAYNNTRYKDVFALFDYFVNPDGTVKSDAEVSEIVAPKKKEKEKHDADTGTSTVAAVAAVTAAEKPTIVETPPVKKEDDLLVIIEDVDTTKKVDDVKVSKKGKKSEKTNVVKVK